MQKCNLKHKNTLQDYTCVLASVAARTPNTDQIPLKWYLTQIFFKYWFQIRTPNTIDPQYILFKDRTEAAAALITLSFAKEHG